MSINNTDSQVINWLRFPMAVLIVLMHTPFLYSVSTDIGLGGMLAVTTHSLIAQVLAQIAVPLFFLFSGYLFFQNLKEWNSRKYLNKLAKRAKTLLLPYVVWNLLFFLVPFVIIPFLREGGADFQALQDRGGWRIFWDNNLFGATEINRINIFGMNMPKGACPIDAPLWFIRDLILISIIAPVIYLIAHYSGKVGLFILGALMILDVWFPIRFLSVTGIFFYSLGCWLSINDKSISDFLPGSWSRIMVFLSIILFFVSATLLIIKAPPAILSICVKCFILSSLVMVLKIVNKGVSYNKLKNYPLLSGSSFFVFALHSGYVMSICSFVISRILPSTNALSSLLGYVISATLITIVCVVVYWFIRKFVPSLLIILSGGR